MPIEHWMTFGTFAEQRYFTYPSETTYTGVIINANMLAHAPSGLAAFLLEKTRKDFPYLIDPLTHAFQHHVSILTDDKGEVKSSIKNLASSYGNVINQNVGINSITPELFDNINDLNEFVDDCICFQDETLQQAIRDRDSFKYLQEFGELENTPYALVAPYFFMTELTVDYWMPLIVRCAERAINNKPRANVKIYSAIVISQGILLEDNLITSIINYFKGVDVDGFLLWVDNLDETNTNRAVLTGLLNLTRGLREGGRRDLINLHGGYFSVISSSPEFGIPSFSGISHGPEFGEFRPVIPVGGGIPVAKFYIRQLHSRVDYKESLRYFRQKDWLDTADSYYNNICNCSECHEVIKDNPANFTIYGLSETKIIKRGMGTVSRDFSLKETKEHCLKHYLNKKVEEYNFVTDNSGANLLAELKSSEEEFFKVAGREAVSHLNLWFKVLSGWK
jgi:hypothetical protein